MGSHRARWGKDGGLRLATLVDINKARVAIEARKISDPFLANCRGYVFNLAYLNGRGVEAVGPVDAIIMGMNPGEDTSKPNAVSAASEGNWERLCQDFANSVGGRWASSEMFFWSSNNLAVLKQRVGDFSPYLAFCADLNRVMIDYHRPRVVFQPGLGWVPDAIKHYGLRHKNTVKLARKPGRLLEHFEMPDGTPWLSTAHWTASFGFSAADKAEIKSYAAALANNER